MSSPSRGLQDWARDHFLPSSLFGGIIGLVLYRGVRPSVTIGAVHKMGRGFRLVQPDSENSICLSAIEGDIAKMVQVSYPN